MDAELKQRAEAATSSYSAAVDLVLVTKNHLKI